MFPKVDLRIGIPIALAFLGLIIAIKYLAGFSDASVLLSAAAMGVVGGRIYIDIKKWMVRKSRAQCETPKA
jgi:hypothetical protein